jgi:hypothetical protein
VLSRTKVDNCEVHHPKGFDDICSENNVVTIEQALELFGTAYHTLLTNTIGKTRDLTTKNILFNMHYQKLIQEKEKAFDIIYIAKLTHGYYKCLLLCMVFANTAGS